ncbi:hypothetical protein ACHAXS_000325 [Conticribra weissflogii]
MDVDFWCKVIGGNHCVLEDEGIKEVVDENQEYEGELVEEMEKCQGIQLHCDVLRSRL